MIFPANLILTPMGKSRISAVAFQVRFPRAATICTLPPRPAFAMITI